MCSDPDCNSGWLQVTEYPAIYGGDIPVDVAKPCPTCKPGWRPHEERQAAAEAVKAKEAEDERHRGLVAAELDRERQAAMFGDDQEGDTGGQLRHPSLGPSGE